MKRTFTITTLATARRYRLDLQPTELQSYRTPLPVLLFRKLFRGVELITLLCLTDTDKRTHYYFRRFI